MRTLNKQRLSDMERYIVEYQKKRGQSPTYREIMTGMKMSSLNLVRKYLLALEKDKRITKTERGRIGMPSRLKTGVLVPVPLCGNIACGDPTDAFENIEESFILPRSLIGSGDFFILRAAGVSMVDVGIDKGDLVVLKKQSFAEEGEIAAVLIDGAESTLKKVYHKNGEIILHPENADMTDIHVKEDECVIQGVLVCCIKMFRQAKSRSVR